ncbi:hypothetical protein N7532_001975 [Penicillium argentinense]|uniref:Uncharacterized protein n=1 Tax=Penicillium argentinense TaxID=1131581 RepID=A0A9W9G4F2_9EURO|nr:uncharacterized protein N7532_001975 [Penicillium argentinense]KAJ5111440.1 hypothetical protein N7532_001975 [Penicillium argentinense]
MQVAEILSDITSLRVCGHHEALALVNVHRTDFDTPVRSGSISAPNDSAVASEPSQTNKDLERAKELVELHYEVKSRHIDGQVDPALQQARADVNKVLRELS